MVESIGPNRVTPLTPGKAVRKDIIDGKSRNAQHDQNKKKPDSKEPEKSQIGSNIDEIC